MTSPAITQTDRMVAFVVGCCVMDSRTAGESTTVAGTGTCKFYITAQAGMMTTGDERVEGEASECKFRK
jgi:hypothetical protein